jgi:hypothetical protein
MHVIYRARGWVFAVGLLVSSASANAALVLSGPEIAGADSFRVFVELDAALGFDIDALQLEIDEGTATLLGPADKDPAVPGEYISVVDEIGFINYLDPATLPMGTLFTLTLQGALASAYTIRVDLLLFATGGSEDGVLLSAVLPEPDSNPNPIPEPGSLFLLSAGLLGLLVINLLVSPPGYQQRRGVGAAQR